MYFVGVGRLNGGRSAIRKFFGDFFGAPVNPGGPQGNPGVSQGDLRGAPGKIIKINPPGVPQTVEGSTV